MTFAQRRFVFVCENAGLRTISKPHHDPCRWHEGIKKTDVHLKLDMSKSIGGSLQCIILYQGYHSWGLEKLKMVMEK